MNREVHVRFWESAEVQFLCATQLSEGLPRRARSGRKPSGLFPILQLRSSTSILGISNSGRGIFSKAIPKQNLWKIGHSPDRPAMRSLIVGHYRKEIFLENLVKRKNPENEGIESLEKP
jgi:hypothetical protein